MPRIHDGHTIFSPKERVIALLLLPVLSGLGSFLALMGLGRVGDAVVGFAILTCLWIAIVGKMSHD